MPRFYARDGVRIDPAAKKEVVIVCDHPFNNVPQRVIFPARWAHAVGYSTGEAGLISPDEFSKLDLREFVDSQQPQPWPRARCAD